MKIDNFLDSGFSFMDDEYELKLQYFMLNAVLKTVAILMIMLMSLRLTQGNYIQVIVDLLFVLISVFAINYIKRSKKNIAKTTTFLLVSFYILIALTFLNTDVKIFGVSWFIVFLLPSFYLRGIKGGVVVTVLSLISIFVFGQIKEDGYTLLNNMYALMPVLVASIFSYLYEKKVSAARELLKNRNIFLEEEVDKKTKEELLLIQENKELADVVSKSNIELFIVDFESDYYLYVNKGGLDALGYTLDEMIKLTVYDINPALTVEMVTEMKELSKTTKNIMNITQHKRKDCSTYGVQSLIHGVTYKGKKAYAIYDINLTDQQKAQNYLLKQKEELLRRAHYDSLTKLPNRTLFNDRLTQAISKSNRYKKDIAVLFIDLDRFKEVNDTLGHSVGDSVLREVSLRFQNMLREADTISRLGGDEFVCIIEDLETPEVASILAQKLIKAVKEPMTIGEDVITLTCSIGISIYPTDATDATMLLHHSDSAMYRAKDSGKDNYMFY